MKKIECEIEILTPMFLGGAAQARESRVLCELRAQSLKGLLRFWWRAYKYGSIDPSLGHDKRLARLADEEGKMFGSSAGAGSKSAFSISTHADPLTTSNAPLPQNHKLRVQGKTFSINILEYLCYGTHEHVKGQGVKFIRDYFMPNQRFKMTFRIHQNQHENEILTALYLSSEFGGIGSRSRNGFGSFCICDRAALFGALGQDYCGDVVRNQSIATRLFSTQALPPFTAFSASAKLFKTKYTFEKWDDCLATLGKIYRNGREILEPKHNYTKRQYIGSPLDPPKDKFRSILERHSKPYFMKVGMTEQGRFYGLILYLPSYYGYNIEKDRFNNPFNGKQETENFLHACAELNSVLEQDEQLEVLR